VTIEFAPLFTLDLVHEYYDGGACPDFGFSIPSSSGRLLAGGRLLAKPRDAGLTVLFEKGEDGNPLAPLPGKTVQFGMVLLNPYFPNFTAWPFSPGEGLPLFGNAGADPAKLQSPVLLQLDPANADDAELMRSQLYCIAEIEIDAAFYTTAPAFQIAFAARQETLKYYVVASNYSSGDFNQLGVSDAGFTADARPQIDFDRVAASAFGADDIPATMLGDADARITLFRSQQPVARREKGRSRIQLARNTDILVTQLPQPGAAAANANLIVHLSK
jgi:hypothetical protein